MSEKAVLLEAKVLLTSYMRRAHDLPLVVDEKILADLIGVAPDAPIADPILGIEILEKDGKRVSVRIPKGFPVALSETTKRRVYVAHTPIGRIQIAKRDLDGEVYTGKMWTILDIVKDVHVSVKIADSLEVGPMSAPVAPPVDTPVAPPPPEKPAKPTREERRLADHKAESCTCQRPPGHECPYVRDFGGTILPLSVVLEKMAAEKAS